MSTYTPIATQTLTSNTTTVTFASIPQNYTDLVLVYFGTNSDDNAGMVLRLNDDAGSNYSDLQFNGYSSGANSTSTNNNPGIDWTFGSANPNRTICVSNFMSYSDPNINKSILTRSNVAGTGTAVRLNAALWRNTSPITSISVFRTGGATILSGATFNLYGIVAGGGYALGGDIVTTDGTYWYHTFLSSGAFIPTKDLTADYLVVAGGGGGGGGANTGAGEGGGGGAGGLRCTVTATGGGGTLESALSLLANTNYSVVIGAGGTGGTENVQGNNGSNSTFANIVSIGGGGAGSRSTGVQHGRDGGSGGGGGQRDEVQENYGLGTTNQGYRGGSGFQSGAPASGGGGGGANSIGATPTGTSTGGAGGSALTVAISGSSVAYAGGGGGAGDTTGGAGGGGGAGSGNNNSTATANTGSGGGGTSGTGGAGGSGIVIVRYAV